MRLSGCPVLPCLVHFWECSCVFCLLSFSCTLSLLLPRCLFTIYHPLSHAPISLRPLRRIAVSRLLSTKTHFWIWCGCYIYIIRENSWEAENILFSFVVVVLLEKLLFSASNFYNNWTKLHFLNTYNWLFFVNGQKNVTNWKMFSKIYLVCKKFIKIRLIYDPRVSVLVKFPLKLFTFHELILIF